MTMRDSRNSGAFGPGGHAGQLRRVAEAAKPLSSWDHATLLRPLTPDPTARQLTPPKLRFGAGWCPGPPEGFWDKLYDNAEC
jgi:hypothetical protein